MSGRSSLSVPGGLSADFMLDELKQDPLTEHSHKSDEDTDEHLDGAVEHPLLPGSIDISQKSRQHGSIFKSNYTIAALCVALCLCCVGLVLCLISRRQATSASAEISPWNVGAFKSLITFGDSYTDEVRMFYFGEHNLTGPPPGTLLPERILLKVWARYVVQYTGSTNFGQWDPQMTLYNYAVGGTLCSNSIVSKFLDDAQTVPSPSVLEYQVPAFIADQEAKRAGTNEPYFQPPLEPGNSVFTMWVGTNDLGLWSFLNDGQVGGKTLSDYADCVYDALDQLYLAGARNFVLFNTAPLHLAPQYANATLHGEGKGDTTTSAEKIHESTTSVNDIFKFQTPYEFRVSQRYPGARAALFDVWSLLREVYFNPEDYLNGTAPANVTSDVKKSDESSPDSFMWWDGLHPSEQTNRIIARNFIEVLNGTSKYADYW